MIAGPCSRLDGFRHLASSCLAVTGRLLAKHRYRIAGSTACREAAHEVAACLQSCCDSVREETFVLHPMALWCVGRAVAANYLLALASLLIGWPFSCVGASLCVIGLAYSLSQYVFYRETFDRLFPGAVGCNVAGSLEPKGVVKQQIILVGHHDSPFIFSFLERFQAIAFIRFLLGMLAYAWLCGYCFVACALHAPGVTRTPVGAALGAAIVGLPFALQLFFMMGRAGSPGAGDNLNGTSIAAALGSHFIGERNRGLPLQHTRLILLSTDGEEIGQRGAIWFVREHAAQLHATSTLVLNIDSVYYARDLAVLTRDRNGTCRLSTSMASDVLGAAEGLGLRVKRASIPFGGGGTDAAAFAAAGIEAVSIVGTPMGLISRDHLYHTSKDTVERIEVGAVTAVLSITSRYIRTVDDRSCTVGT